MSKEQLQLLLDAEMRVWAAKPAETLERELSNPVGYHRGMGNGWHQFEVMILERTEEHVHVGLTVDDGSDQWARAPLCSSFIVYRDGRIDI